MKIDLNSYEAIQKESLKQLQQSDNGVTEFLNKLLNIGVNKND